MRIRIAVLFVSVILSGCFFAQQAPQTQATTQTPFILGIATMEDVQVANQAGIAAITAYFLKQTDQKTKPVSATVQDGRFGMDVIDPNSRGPECVNQVVPRDKENRGDNAALPMGKVEFGPILQEDLMTLDRTSQNVYQGLLAPGLPAGGYQLLAHGEGGIGAFMEPMTMPEALSWVRVNGTDFGEPDMQYKRGDKLEISWRAPTIENSQNQILIGVVARDDQATFKLRCLAYESELQAVDSLKTWSIDYSFLRDIPHKAEMAVQLTRGHVLTPQRQTYQALLQGMRTYYATIAFVED